MSSFELLKRRISFRGETQLDRLEKDKLNSLNSALKNSYHSELITTNDGNIYSSLINPDKESLNHDDKIISLPFYATPKGSSEIQKMPLKVGDTFYWEKTNSHWIIFLQHLDETAYFRADMRKCDQSIKINDMNYWIYIRGPQEESMEWRSKYGLSWNTLNYTMVLYITKDENTSVAFHRLQFVKIKDPCSGELKNWKIVAHNSYGENILRIYLREDYSNDLEEERLEKEEAGHHPLPPEDPTLAYIKGPTIVHKYDTVQYEAVNADENGKWIIKDKENLIELGNGPVCQIDILKSKGQLELTYMHSEDQKITLLITIEPY